LAAEDLPAVTPDFERVALPLLFCPSLPLLERARQLLVDECAVDHARRLIKKWHSRLPVTQPGPWRFAFHAHYDGVSYAVALLNNPSARTLPGHWLELRRMAVAADAPHCTASYFLNAMAKVLKKKEPQAEKIISYQDEAVHKGTIYKAAGWHRAARQVPRVRDRSKPRPSGRMYRWNINGAAADSAGKVRWEYTFQ
jgi:hypothetical protein